MCILNILQTTDYTILELNDDNIVERQAEAAAVAVAVAAIFNMDYCIYLKSYAEKS